MNDRHITIDKSIDIEVDVDLDKIDLSILKANVLRRMREGKIDPGPDDDALARNIERHNVDAALVDQAYYALRIYTPTPIRELVLALKGRIA